MKDEKGRESGRGDGGGNRMSDEKVAGEERVAGGEKKDE